MAEGGIRPPGIFTNGSSNPSEASRNWNAWLEQFDYYMLATEKNSKPGEVQVATLLTLLGAQGQEIFRTFSLSADQKKNIKTVKKAFTKHFTPQVKVVFERFKFNSRKQKEGEPFDSFLTSLRDLIAACDFHADEQDKVLLDRIVAGVCSD